MSILTRVCIIVTYQYQGSRNVRATNFNGAEIAEMRDDRCQQHSVRDGSQGSEAFS
jgi:hypothetical protein